MQIWFESSLVQVQSPLSEEARTPVATQPRVEVEDSKASIWTDCMYACHGYVSSRPPFEKQLYKGREWVLQQEVMFPEGKELPGRMEMDSPAAKMKSYFLQQRYFVNALLIGELTL